ncbi:MAG: hypothetical protein M3Y24_02080 [Acidobacteriota bacterium]|nr:hypothetical protein [Acidobacteriota bacterium]
MHGPIRDRLEDLLKADGAATIDKNVVDHLASCEGCSSELAALRDQSLQFATYRPRESVEPSAGFYARVLQRIEERQSDSIWGLFIESGFSKRLAVASLTLAIALGSYVVRQENRDGKILTVNMLAQSDRLHYDALVMGSQTEQRDAVLSNFLEHNGEAR